MPFDQFTAKFNKQYNVSEMSFRSRIYAHNLALISAHNDNAKSHGFTMAINQFADYTASEFKAILGVSKPNQRSFAGLTQVPAPIFHTKVSDLPSAVDWRNTANVVSPVKNQAQCGSCWAFATTETLESHAALSVDPPQMKILAPQQLVDCAPNPKKCGGTGGCEGSTAEIAYDYIASLGANGGMTEEKNMPYKGRDMTCSYNPTKTPPAATASGFVKLPENNYTALLNAIATLGPIAISVEADTWSFYGGGIFPANKCNLKNTDIDHAVQLVGYGTDAGKDYWIVRNSWGASWGEKGFIRIERSSDGLPCNKDTTPGDGSACPPFPSEVTVCGACGIIYDTCYPVGAKWL